VPSLRLWLAARDRALARGLTFVERATRRPQALESFGSALIYSLSFMATTALDAEVRRYTRQLALRSFRLWQQLWGPRLPADHDADTVSEFVHAYGAAERLGLRFPRQMDALRRASRRFRAADYLWFDPRREPPPADVPEFCACGWSNPRRRRRCVNRGCRARLDRMSPLRVWTISLTAAFCGDRNGVPFGIGYERMMRWLPRMRAYQGPGDVAAFYDSAYAISHVVYTLNDYGVWLLDPRLLPAEFEYLRTHLPAALEVGDPDMVGEFLDSLRAFGLGNQDAQVAAGIDFLVGSQNRDGSWGEADGNGDYPRFHATWAALDGLRDFAWRGPGLSYPRLRPALRRWAREATA
jgi:hypothetical protein